MATYRAKKHKVKDVVWQSVVTGSTLTAVAGNGYWIDTTSNACTITLPASASVGDTIVFADYARNWGTNKITIDSNGLNYQGDSDVFTIEYSTDGMTLDIVYVDATKGWIPTIDEAVGDAPSKPGLEGIFGYGANSSWTKVSMSNKVSSSGVVASDVSGVGTARSGISACEYGGDKGIFGFGYTNQFNTFTAVTNLVSNTGVISSDVAGVGVAKNIGAACAYGGDKGIFGFGQDQTMYPTAATKKVSNTGVVAADTAGVGTARYTLAACEYGGDRDKGIFGYGYISPSGHTSMTNLVSNTGVVATDTSGVGHIRQSLSACGYGGDKGIFGYGNYGGGRSMTNLVSNTGVVATDTTGVGTARYALAACEYGVDKGIFGYGSTNSMVSVTNLVSNAGVVSSDVTGVGTARYAPAACTFN